MEVLDQILCNAGHAAAGGFRCRGPDAAASEREERGPDSTMEERSPLHHQANHGALTAL